VKNLLGHGSRLSSSTDVGKQSLLAILVLFGFTVFFAYPNNSYRSLFRQAISFFGITTYFEPYFQIRTAIYVFSLGVGLLLTAVFLTKVKRKEQANRCAAVNLAWLAFVLEASVGLGLQWTPIDVWMALNDTAFAVFIVTLVLLSASVLLLMPIGSSRIFGLGVSVGFLVSCVFGLGFMLKYFLSFNAPFPTLMCVMAASTAISVSKLQKYRMPSTRKDEHSRTSFHGAKWKRTLASPKILAIILTGILVFEIFAFVQPGSYWEGNYASTNNFYLGVAFCGNTTLQAKTLIDRVAGFTNLFVVQSLPISQNENVLNEICDYAVNAGLSVVVYFSVFHQYWQIGWLDSAKERWGAKFLGVYLYDEPGGMQLDNIDYLGWPGGRTPSDYSDAANSYLTGFRNLRGRSEMKMLKMRNMRTITSDYALYWFDYRVGYDVVFAEFGWNYSRQLNVALCRGAATAQNKEWGIIITWTYTQSPYIEPADKLYDDAILAYENGANYVLIFDHPYDSESKYGILQEEHLLALGKFWNYSKDHLRPENDSKARTAYVLPKDYAYGFRGPNDKIWGLWEADTFTTKLILDVGNALARFGTQLDIIYEDGVHTSSPNVPGYDMLLYWNETMQ